MELIFLTSLILSLMGMIIIVWRKLPVLAKLPQGAVSRINTREAILNFIKTIKNKTPLKNFSGQMFLQKVLSKIRVLVLKIDNKTFHWLQTLRENSRKNKFGENDNYWQEVKNSTNQENSVSSKSRNIARNIAKEKRQHGKRLPG